MYIPFRKLQHQLKKKLDSDYRRKNKKKKLDYDTYIAH